MYNRQVYAKVFDEFEWKHRKAQDEAQKRYVRGARIDVKKGEQNEKKNNN